LGEWGSVDLWLWHDLHLLSSRQVDEYQQPFSASESLRLGRINDQRRKLEYIGGHHLLRRMLDHLYPNWFSTLYIEHPGEGAPFLNGVNPLGIEFNLSHSGNTVCCAVGTNHRIGLDIESPTRRRPIQEMADTYFSRSEAQQLTRLPGSAKLDYFYRTWTLKESLLKARRSSLSSVNMKVEFRCLANPPIPISAEGLPWYCYSFRNGRNYLALSLSRPLVSPLRLESFNADLGAGSVTHPPIALYTPRL